MPKVKTIQTNFSAGVLSPRAYGRVDIARYPNAIKSGINVLVNTLGGAEKRPGTQYIAAAKNADKTARLIPYIIDRDTAYMMEVGESYIRFFDPDGAAVESGGSPYELTTSYTEAQVGELDYAQAEQAMYLFHGSVYPARLRRFAATNWNIGNIPFDPEPFDEIGMWPAVSITLSANTVGAGRTATASGAVFLASDVGRAILQNGGVAVITVVTDSTHATVTINSVFDSGTLSSGAWNMDSSPQTTLTPEDLGADNAPDPVGSEIDLVLSANGWRSGDVGKFVRINGGLVEITAFTDALTVTGTIVREMTAPIAAPASAWTLNSSIWNATDGYPRTGTRHEQRLVAGGNAARPQTFCGSVTGNDFNFTIGTNDDDAFAFTIAGEDSQVNRLHYLVSGRDLMAMTYGGEYSIRGGLEKPITPTNISIRPQSSEGSDGTVRPVTVGKETLFAQRARRKLLAFGFHIDVDAYKAIDLTTLSEHLTKTGIIATAFQREPFPVVWVVLTNGRLLSLTLDRELDVVAWTQHEMLGAVESVAVMPGGDADQVWLIVRRSVDGGTVRYVERLQPEWFPVYGTAIPDYDAYPVEDEPYSWGYMLDCAISQDSAGGTDTWANLDHLEGETVRCIADGLDMGEFTVASGEITLSRDANRTLIGLMVTPTVELLRPEIPVAGTSQSSAISTNEVTVRLRETIGATINGQAVALGRYYAPDQLDSAPETFSGDVRVSTLGWDRGKDAITISQEAPFPWTVLAVIRSVTVNDG